jgi:small-conductance mechanosensitive channel
MIESLYDKILKIFNSEHPFLIIINDIYQIFLSLWNHPIFITNDKQKILVSNAILGLILFFIGSKIVKKINLSFKKKLHKVIHEEGTVNSLERLSYYFFMMIMIIFVLDISNVPLTMFTVIGTTLALGIGLGSQNIVNNFISGIIIIIERPIKIGDIIEVKGTIGKVINIGARCTSIQTSQNINMLIPNSNILQDVIVNWTLEDTILKSNISLCIEDKVSFTEIDSILLSILDNHPNILKTPKPQVIVKNLFSNGYELEIDFWIDLALNGKINYIVNDLYRVLLVTLREKNIAIIDKPHCTNL